MGPSAKDPLHLLMMFCVTFFFQFLILLLPSASCFQPLPSTGNFGDFLFVVGFTSTMYSLALESHRFLALSSRSSKSGGKSGRTLGRWHFSRCSSIRFHLFALTSCTVPPYWVYRDVFHLWPGRGWEFWNLIVTFSMMFSRLPASCSSVVDFFLSSYFEGPLAGDDPSNTSTLESIHSSRAVFPSFARISGRRAAASAVGFDPFRRSTELLKYGWRTSRASPRPA